MTSITPASVLRIKWSGMKEEEGTAGGSYSNNPGKRSWYEGPRKRRQSDSGCVLKVESMRCADQVNTGYKEGMIPRFQTQVTVRMRLP